MKQIANSLLVFVVATITVCFGSTVQFNNHCGSAVAVIKTENGQGPVQICSLNPGQSCSGSYSSNGMNFKNGAGGLTLAEFSFNSYAGQDFYDLSVVVGYDTAMQISSSTGGPTVTCTAPGCPEAYLYPGDDSKTHGTPTGGTFQVTFCP